VFAAAAFFGLPAGTKWRNLMANNTLLKQAPF
jgi:hypothetical protein